MSDTTEKMQESAPRDQELEQLAVTLGTLCEARGVVLATAESCTGGWVAQALTAVPGSSAWFDRGFVTYSNAAKQDMLGVPASVLATFGAVSAETVAAMARGALSRSGAGLAVSISGVAGPSGGSPEKPVGTVWFGFAATARKALSRCCHFPGDRQEVRARAVRYALRELTALAQGMDWPTN